MDFPRASLGGGNEGVVLHKSDLQVRYLLLGFVLNVLEIIETPLIKRIQSNLEVERGDLPRGTGRSR